MKRNIDITTATQPHNGGRVSRIMESYNTLPGWVKFWMNFILGPINLATLAFLNEPSGVLIAALSIGGMAMVVSLVVITGGFTKIVAGGHIPLWTPLVAMLAFAPPQGSAIYGTFLIALLVINAIALAFDYNDVRIWLQSRKRG